MPKVLMEKKEIYLTNPSLEELVKWIRYYRAISDFDDFKFMIDGTNEETDTSGELFIPEGVS